MTRDASRSRQDSLRLLPAGAGAVPQVSAILGKRILITGDVNTGKTLLTKTILDEMCRRRLASRIAIIDMAPEIPEEIALQRGMKGVGGKLISRERDVLYLAAPLRPPRLSSKTEEGALLIAAENREKIGELLKAFEVSGRDILFVNDVSVYLHAGSADDLLQAIRAATTIVANGYYGERLGAGILSVREASQMRRLIAAFPLHITLPATSPEQAPG